MITWIPVLAGFSPGSTGTVSRLDPPGHTPAGASPSVPRGSQFTTFTTTPDCPIRPSASVIVTGTDRAAKGDAAPTTACAVYVPSPAAASGATPSSRNTTPGPPPICVVSPITLTMGDAGDVPCVTATVITTFWFRHEGEGADAPMPDGGVEGVHTLNGVALFRGAAGTLVKSAALSLVSWHPWFPRITEFALLVPGPAPDPSKHVAPPYVTRSTRLGFANNAAHAFVPPPVIAVVVLLSSTFPEAPPIAIGDVAIRSGVGSACEPPAPCDCWIR